MEARRRRHDTDPTNHREANPLTLPRGSAARAPPSPRNGRGDLTNTGFTGAGLDRADHVRLDAEQLADMMANGDARLLRLAELDPVLDEEGRLAWGPLDGGERDYLFLGLDEGAPLFAPLVRMQALGQRAWSVFRLLGLMSPRDAAIWGAARSVNEWHNRHRFCGICGAETGIFRAGWAGGRWPVRRI